MTGKIGFKKSHNESKLLLRSQTSEKIPIRDEQKTSSRHFNGSTYQRLFVSGGWRQPILSTEGFPRQTAQHLERM